MYAMEILALISLCIITVAYIQRQHASMRRLQRVRIEKDERSKR